MGWQDMLARMKFWNGRDCYCWVQENNTCKMYGGQCPHEGVWQECEGMEFYHEG